MKDSLAAFAGALLIAYGTVAMAASSVQLPVKGSSLFGLNAQDNRSSIAGPAAHPIYSIDNASTWLYNPDQPVPANTLNAFGNSASVTRAAAPLTAVALDLMVQPYILLPAGETIPPDGSTSFERRYL